MLIISLMTVKYFCLILIPVQFLENAPNLYHGKHLRASDSLHDENKTIRIDSSIGSELMLVKVHPRLRAVPFGILIAVESRNRNFQCTLHSDKLDTSILRDAHICQTPFDLFIVIHV